MWVPITIALVMFIAFNVHLGHDALTTTRRDGAARGHHNHTGEECDDTC